MSATLAGVIRHCSRCNAERYCHATHGVWLCLKCWIDKYLKGVAA